ncbi:MerR family transcriptional regulator [Fusibacter paucivorans]|uniref:MerR family transcriptional regulator n=1 Tax=Fusibacter paucivorans TaxID=76009 RepID=A0ABS5PJY2_9FIRM|nr:MerR family transcriptional regulator [Fusibacter paucivorans]MBS7525303.1 MerR family transcriptional regulator [Fusibacter paucivorans]
MTYSIGEVSNLLDISISTLRYYDKEGLLPLVNRTEGNIRRFNDTDIECLNMIECLKTTGMPLKDIKVFFEWCEIGDDTIDQRYELFLAQKQKTEEKIKELETALKRINYKVEYYRIAKEKGTTSSPDFEEALAMRYLQKKDTQSTEDQTTPAASKSQAV